MQIGGHSLQRRFSISWKLRAVESPPMFVGNLTNAQSTAVLHIANKRVNSRKSAQCKFGGVSALTLVQISMDQIAVTGASGLHARMEALDLVANNLANATTGGFKLDREFYSLFTASDDTGVDGNSVTKLPVIQKQWTDFSQGTLQPTGNPLDLALTGKGFFVVNGASGPLYTRSGSFQLSSSGALTTAEGYPVQTADGKILQTDSQAPLEVAADGSVTQDGEDLGQLNLVDFQDRSVLQKVGNSYFGVTDAKVKAIPAADVTVSQGKIENSNVAPAESAVRLVGLMRQFEMLQKAISITTDMNKKALEDVARVGGGS
jgi:flagellar basal-body rod protein FlgF